MREKSETVKTENDILTKTQESNPPKDEINMEEEGEILTELQHSSTTTVSQMDVGGENIKLESQFQIDENELQGLNRKQRRERIRQLKKAFEEKQLQSDLDSCHAIEKVVESSEKVEEYSKVTFTLSSEPEMIETGFSVYGCDELCSSTSESSIHMEETSVNSSIIVSDSSIVTVTSTCSPQANESLDLAKSTDREQVQKSAEQPQGGAINPSCRECGKIECKVLNACNVMAETLYQGNLSDDTQNAVDFDFVSKIKHDNHERSEESSLDLIKGVDELETLKHSMSCDVVKSVEGDSTMKDCSSSDAAVTSSTLTMKNSTVNDTESQSLNLVKSCDQSNCEDSEESGSLCTDESELESGELTDSSEEEEGILDGDRVIVQVEEAAEDQGALRINFREWDRVKLIKSSFESICLLLIALLRIFTKLLKDFSISDEGFKI